LTAKKKHRVVINHRKRIVIEPGIRGTRITVTDVSGHEKPGGTRMLSIQK